MNCSKEAPLLVQRDLIWLQPCHSVCPMAAAEVSAETFHA